MNFIKPLDALWLQNALQNACPNTSFAIEVLATIDSTNRYLLEKETENFHVCLAEQQTTGRGRMGKAWVSPHGVNLYCSIAWLFDDPILKASGLSLLTGIITAKALEEYGVSCIELKWPNDLLYQHKKIGGILIEMIPYKKNIYKIVIGIGINVFLSRVLKQDDQRIKQPWTDVTSALYFEPDRNQIAYTLLKNLFETLPIFTEKGFAEFQPSWLAKDTLLNQTVTLETGKKTLKGISKGVDSRGYLLVDIEGKIESFSSAEVIQCRVD